MFTNVEVDEKLVEEAQRIGGHSSREAAVIEALEEYIRRRKQVEILRLFGQINYDPDYDYKSLRR